MFAGAGGCRLVHRWSYARKEQKMKDLYISVDIETDGPIPGDNNMVTIGAVPVARNGKDGRWYIGTETFYSRLERRPNAVSDKQTMEWWREQAHKMYEEAFLAQPRTHPMNAMQDFVDWTRELHTLTYKTDEVILAAAPIMFDGMWVRWYLEHYLGSSRPFSHRGLDMKSFWMGGGPNRTYADAHHPHNDLFESLVGKQAVGTQHHALYDAQYQALVLTALLNDRDDSRWVVEKC
jgi:hypothetical protein